MSFTEDMENLLPDVLIHNVTFDHQDRVVEIVFAELRDQVEGIGMLKTIALEQDLFFVEIDQLSNYLRNLVSEAQIGIRNEDARNARIKKAKNRFVPESEDEDDQ